MSDKSPPAKLFMEFDENDPRFQIHILSNRIDQMQIDHDRERAEDKKKIADLEKDMEGMKRVYQRGLGFGSAIIGLGVVIGFLFNYGKLIFAPWRGTTP